MPESTPEAVSSVILKAVSAPKEELRKMGEGGRRRIEENFTWDKCAERMEEVYEKMLASHNFLHQGGDLTTPQS